MQQSPADLRKRVRTCPQLEELAERFTFRRTSAQQPCGSAQQPCGSAQQPCRSALSKPANVSFLKPDVLEVAPCLSDASPNRSAAHFLQTKTLADTPPRRAARLAEKLGLRHTYPTEAAPKAPPTAPQAAGRESVGKSGMARLKAEVWEMFFPRASRGDCPVCGCEVTWHRWQLAHIEADKLGGAMTPENLIVACGCNQMMSIQNVLDFMGTHYAHRQRRLMALVVKLFYARLTVGERRALLERHAKHTLIEFARQTYRPAKLDTYAKWLEIDSIDWHHLVRSPLDSGGQRSDRSDTVGQQSDPVGQRSEQ